MSPKCFDPLWIKSLNSNLRHSELRKTEPSQLIDERHGKKVTKLFHRLHEVIKE